VSIQAGEGVGSCRPFGPKLRHEPHSVSEACVRGPACWRQPRAERMPLRCLSSALLPSLSKILSQTYMRSPLMLGGSRMSSPMWAQSAWIFSSRFSAQVCGLEPSPYLPASRGKNVQKGQL